MGLGNRGIDRDEGWINRRFRDLQRQIEGLRSEQRAGATEISEGNLTISGGGQVVIKHIDDSDAVTLGTQNYGTEEAPLLATGLVITDELGGTLVEAVKDWFSGSRFRAVATHAVLEHPTTGGIIGFVSSLWGTTAMVDGKAGAATVRSDTSTTVESDGLLTLDGGATNAVRLYTAGTTGASANVYRSILGELVTVVSSRRYKRDIADHDIDPQTVLRMRVRTWRDRSEVRKDPDCDRRYVGFIAEEIHDLGLTEFLSYDDEGRPDAVAYDRVPAALLVALRWVAEQARDRTNTLEETIKAQQGQIDTLTARLDALSPSQPAQPSPSKGNR